MVRRGGSSMKLINQDKPKIGRYLPPTEGAFLGSLIRAGARWVAGRHKDSINIGLEKAARRGMFGRRKVKKPRVPMPPPPNYPSWMRSRRWG